MSVLKERLSLGHSHQILLLILGIWDWFDPIPSEVVQFSNELRGNGFVHFA